MRPFRVYYLTPVLVVLLFALQISGRLYKMRKLDKYPAACPYAASWYEYLIHIFVPLRTDYGSH